ncbi:MAG TPA: ABC transporter permease [Acetobacteraceae bacterium]|nr:ABC transporter permease [Acetobacteraceae bacterium]
MRHEDPHPDPLPKGEGDTRRSGSLRPYLLAALPAAFLLIFFALPTVFLLSASFLRTEDMVVTSELTLDNYNELVSSPLYRGAILRSFVVGLSSGALVVLLAYPLAYFLARTRSRWRGTLIALSLAPLLASVIVRTYGWWVVLNREGALNTFLLGIGAIDRPLLLLPSTGAIVLGITHALLPYGVLTIMASLNGLDPGLERAAMSLGAGRLRTFLNVTLPLTAPGVAGGFLLTFAIAISAYATPAILGGPGTQVMATMVQTFMLQLLDWAAGSAMGAILLVSSVVLVILMSAIGNERRAA